MQIHILYSIFTALTVAVATETPEPFSLFNQRTIFKPYGAGRASYARYVELQDGTLLVTSSWGGGPKPPVFPVFESKDGGVSWTWISNITDQVNGWGMPAQPALLELHEPIGDYDTGTVLASGNSWNWELGTRIDLYASTDKGY